MNGEKGLYRGAVVWYPWPLGCHLLWGSSRWVWNGQRPPSPRPTWRNPFSVSSNPSGETMCGCCDVLLVTEKIFFFLLFFRFFGSFLFLLLLWRLTALFASSWSTWDFVCCAAVYISPLARLADRPRHPRRSLFRHHTQHHTLALSLLVPRQTITTTGREEEEEAKILLFFSTQQHTHTHTGHKTLGQRSTRCCLFPKRRQPHSAALMANDEGGKDETVRRGSNLVLFCGKIKKSRLAFFLFGAVNCRRRFFFRWLLTPCV